MVDIITTVLPDGKTSIYQSPQSDAIEADPHADIGRVLFHSALNYITVEEVISGVVNLTANGYDASGKKIYNVYEHGLGYSPLLFGKVLNLRALNVEGDMLFPLPLTTGVAPFSGTLPIGSDNIQPAGWYIHKNVQLGVNNTYVTVTDVTTFLGPSPLFAPYDTFTYDLEYQVAITTFQLPV